MILITGSMVDSFKPAEALAPALVGKGLPDSKPPPQQVVSGLARQKMGIAPMSGVRLVARFHQKYGQPRLGKALGLSRRIK
ncbi:MAG: hypothetical protein IPJ12_04060 [Betaproteobacteria bacterium]|nr:hypothetical protein [Betaproteobacteria bacterium]